MLIIKNLLYTYVIILILAFISSVGSKTALNDIFHFVNTNFSCLSMFCCKTYFQNNQLQT